MNTAPMVDHPFNRCYGRRLLLADEEKYLHGLATRFSYVLPEPHLVDVIARYSPLVELGAGTGYWAYLLRSIGADILAYDLVPLGGRHLNRYHPDVRPWTEVLDGDVEVLLKHAERSLFLCWPPRYSNLWESLRFYKGESVLYIGDRGVRTPELAILDRAFVLVEKYAAIAMDPAPGTRAELTVWRRVGEPGSDST